MKKSFYLFICLLLATSFWHLSFIEGPLKRDGIFVLTMMWTLAGYIFFYGQKRITVINSFRYKWYAYGILAGVFISVYSALTYWGQSISVTLLTQRFIYTIILLPALLFVQPSESDIFKALRWISFATMGVWLLSAVAPQLILKDGEVVTDRIENKTTSIGIYVEGIEFVVLYLYFLIQKYIQAFTFKKLMGAMGVVLFFILYQNRSMLIGVALILFYSIIKLKSRYKFLMITIISLIIVGFVVYTASIWITFFQDTTEQLSDMDYNRWKALDYFFSSYSPKWFCYVFGNGMPSGGNSAFGNKMLDLWDDGIYASDLGLIGMWADFGIIPVILVYSIIIRGLFKSRFPRVFRFICFHILLVPTIFHFWSNPGVTFFSLIIYMYAYYTEYPKILQQYASYNHSQLQERSADCQIR